MIIKAGSQVPSPRSTLQEAYHFHCLVSVWLMLLLKSGLQSSFYPRTPTHSWLRCQQLGACGITSELLLSPHSHRPLTLRFSVWPYIRITWAAFKTVASPVNFISFSGEAQVGSLLSSYKSGYRLWLILFITAQTRSCTLTLQKTGISKRNHNSSKQTDSPYLRLLYIAAVSSIDGRCLSSGFLYRSHGGFYRVSPCVASALPLGGKEKISCVTDIRISWPPIRVVIRHCSFLFPKSAQIFFYIYSFN